MKSQHRDIYLSKQQYNEIVKEFLKCPLLHRRWVCLTYNPKDPERATTLEQAEKHFASYCFTLAKRIVGHIEPFAVFEEDKKGKIHIHSVICSDKEVPNWLIQSCWSRDLNPDEIRWWITEATTKPEHRRVLEENGKTFILDKRGNKRRTRRGRVQNRKFRPHKKGFLYQYKHHIRIHNTCFCGVRQHQRRNECPYRDQSLNYRRVS
mgnify:CR=1 FL=1|jgi:hypothetical protein